MPCSSLPPSGCCLRSRRCVAVISAFVVLAFVGHLQPTARTTTPHGERPSGHAGVAVIAPCATPPSASRQPPHRPPDDGRWRRPRPGRDMDESGADRRLQRGLKSSEAEVEISSPSADRAHQCGVGGVVEAAPPQRHACSPTKRLVEAGDGNHQGAGPARHLLRQSARRNCANHAAVRHRARPASRST